MSQLKILHVTDSDPDDPRILKAATTGKRVGHQLHFQGWNLERKAYEELFESYSSIPFGHAVFVAREMNPYITLAYSILGKIPQSGTYLYPFPHLHAATEKRCRQVVDRVRPDIIHAHNIIAAHYYSRFGIPMVLDDHEFLSLHVKALNEKQTKLKKIIGYRVAEKRWIEWEAKLGEKCPVITVSDPIADEWRKKASNVYTVPNYPLKDSISKGMLHPAQPGNDIVSVYLGTDHPDRPRSMRNINGLYEMFKGYHPIGKLVRIGVKYPQTKYIYSIGNVEMNLAYDYMKDHCHVGLLSWQKHWFQPYCCPNKLAEYAHCGLYVMFPDNMQFMIKEFAGKAFAFRDFGQIRNELAKLNQDTENLNKLRFESMMHARENLIWEKHDSKILEAYGKA